MGQIIYFDICAEIIMLVTLLTVLVRRRFRGRKNIEFVAVSLVVLCAVTFDLLSVTTDNYFEVPMFLRRLIHTLYLLFHSLSLPVYLSYLITLTDTWHRILKRWYMRIGLVAPVVITICLLFVNLFVPILFSFDSDGLYRRDKAFVILYVIALLYAILGIVYLCAYRKLFSNTTWVALVMIFPLDLIAAIIQMFFPNLLVEMFTNSVSILCLALFTQNTEENELGPQMLGRSAYLADMRRKFINKRDTDLMFLNICNYNTLNDMLGYETMGDLIKIIAQNIVHLGSTLGYQASHYYLGQGEFLTIVDTCANTKTGAFAQKLNQELKHPVHLQHMDVGIEANICLVRCPKNVSDMSGLLSMEKALQERAYHGQVQYADHLFKKEEFDVKKNIDRIIERALVNHYFEVYYQPIYSVEEKKFNSAEALLRLIDPEFGFVSPEFFIPAAEKNGMIHQIGAYVLEEVCKFIASDEFKNLGIDYIEVNLSVAQCMHSTLAQDILDMLVKYHVSPKQINLEITETAASYSQNIFMRNLEELSEAGILFSLDDFGTGYSNMTRVAELPLHIVKLDKSFADSESDPRMRVIIRNMVNMIKDMDMKIVVEGIETEQLLKTFTEMQCDYIQGYYYSKPIPKGDFITFIQNSQDESNFNQV